MKFVRESIATKISILIILLVMVTASFVGMIFYYGGNKVLVQREFEKIDRKTKAIGHSLKVGLSELKRDTLTLANVSNVKNISNSKNWKKDIQRLTKFKHSYISIHYFNNKAKLKESFQRNNTNFVNSNNIESEIGKYLSQIKNLEESEVFLTDIWLNKLGKKIEKPHRPILFSIAPVFNKNGREGFLALKYDFSDLFRQITALANNNESLFVTNSEGDYLIHPQKLKTFGFNLGIRYKINDDFPILTEKLSPDFETEKGQGFITNYQNQKFLIHNEKAYLTGSNNNTYLKVTIGISYDDVIGSSNVIRTRSFYLSLGLIILTALVGWVTTKYLTKHLDRITEMAQRYTRGETDIHIPVESKDEIGVLSLTFQGMVRQVNERTRILRKNERELREARDRTEQSLKEKNEVLDDLKKQKEEVERVSKDKDELLAIVSHDLKNPLAVIETSMDILMEDEGANHSDMTKDLIRRAKSSSRFALNLITDLLEVARLEGGIKLDFEKFAVKDMISSVLDGFFLKAQEKNINLETRFAGDFEVYADYGRFIQVLNNIIGNSLKFTPQNGKIIIHVSSFEGRRKLDGSGRILKIVIEDNGPGIPADKIDSIFNKFEQARVKDREIGTGLGLAISKNITTLHNGNIWVESVEGEGAKFFVTIPRLIEESVNKPVVNDEEFNPLILLADDSEDYRQFVKGKLSNVGMTVIEAENGEIALQVIQEKDPDLVLLDLDMPVKGGVEVLEELRASEKYKDLPIIVISEHLATKDLELINKLANEFIHKSSGEKDLEFKIREILQPGNLGHLDKALDLECPTILIVDDEEPIRELVGDRLEKIGYNTLKAKNGVEALFFVKKYSVDLLISDIRMPEVDGLTLSRMLIKEKPDLPIILMSGNLVEIPATLKKKLGVFALISKPFDLAELTKIVNEAVPLKQKINETLNEKVDNLNIKINETAIEESKELETQLTAQENSQDSIGTIEDVEDVKLLLVDDSEDMQMLFKVMLRKENYLLSVASDGKEGLELFKTKKFDIILMDIKMPVMDGIEAIVEMRKFEVEQSITETPVYAISANDSEEDIKKYLSNGFTGSVSKPLNKEKILGLLKERKAS